MWGSMVMSAKEFLFRISPFHRYTQLALYYLQLKIFFLKYCCKRVYVHSDPVHREIKEESFPYQCFFALTARAFKKKL